LLSNAVTQRRKEYGDAVFESTKTGSYLILNHIDRPWIPNSMEMLNFQNESINLAEHWGDSITETVEAFDELQLWDRAY